jgi:hypothetical protein
MPGRIDSPTAVFSGPAVKMSRPSARTGHRSPEDPLEEMCDHLTDSFEACATESTTSTGTASAECEDTFAECSQADLDLLVGIGDCVAADCEDFTCYDAFADLSPECLGITAGT